MAIHRVKYPCFFATLLAVLPGCGAADDAAPEGDAAEAHAPFSTAPGEPNHEEITALGLAFLKPEIRAALQVANVATDVQFALVNANHFDDCNFLGGSSVVSTSQAEAVANLNPSLATPATDALALRYFGRSLHAVQDFYAHTNWIELGGDTLVDGSLAAFAPLQPYTVIPSSGFVVVQGKAPKRAALERKGKAPYPTSAVVSVKLGKSHAPGLISGTVDYEPGNFCPAPVAMTHEELNKDKSSNANRTAQFAAARSLAIAQTEHEWCRLVELTREAWGDEGVAHLQTWLDDVAPPPSCSP
jgi:hypothetical protein